MYGRSTPGILPASTSTLYYSFNIVPHHVLLLSWQAPTLGTRPPCLTHASFFSKRSVTEMKLKLKVPVILPVSLCQVICTLEVTSNPMKIL